MDSAGTGRIADPRDGGRTFTWLAEAVYDPAGNAIRYVYVPEDGVDMNTSQAFERHRGGPAQRYLKRIDYGNTPPLQADVADPANNAWSFSVVLDYGDHRAALPGLQPDQPWPGRPDPYSSYRAGFEVRTHRLCRRVLLFPVFMAEVQDWRKGKRSSPDAGVHYF